ncbi:MAG: hypothetical protein AAF747_00305, partial [Planctomycetota bacterium]
MRTSAALKALVVRSGLWLLAAWLGAGLLASLTGIGDLPTAMVLLAERALWAWPAVGLLGLPALVVLWLSLMNRRWIRVRPNSDGLAFWCAFLLTAMH